MLTTASGAEAITMAEHIAPDLIVLDLGLPDVPGEEVAREVRCSSQVPILTLTAKSAEDDRIRGLEVGADDYLTKPFGCGSLGGTYDLRIRAQPAPREEPSSAGPARDQGDRASRLTDSSPRSSGDRATASGAVGRRFKSCRGRNAAGSQRTD